MKWVEENTHTQNTEYQP